MASRSGRAGREASTCCAYSRCWTPSPLRSTFMLQLLRHAPPIPTDRTDQLVTAPTDADETSFAYFAITPVAYLGAGAVHVFMRSASSAALTSTSRRRLATSTTIVSPSRTAASGP